MTAITSVLLPCLLFLAFPCVGLGQHQSGMFQHKPQTFLRAHRCLLCGSHSHSHIHVHLPCACWIVCWWNLIPAQGQTWLLVASWLEIEHDISGLFSHRKPGCSMVFVPKCGGLLPVVCRKISLKNSTCFMLWLISPVDPSGTSQSWAVKPDTVGFHVFSCLADH